MNADPRMFPPTTTKTTTWRADFFASVVVFLVALPLCLGIAIASGCDPVAGLITGIIGGAIVGTFSGSPMQVSGPAVGLVTILAGITAGSSLGLTATEDNPRPGLYMLGVIVILAGVIQILAGLCRIGQWFRAVSPAVIQGMLAGIGVLIVLSQLQVLIDHKPHSEGWHNLLEVPNLFHVATGWHNPQLKTSGQAALMLGLVALVSMLLWKPLAPKPLKPIPAALVGIILTAGVAYWTTASVQYVQLPDKLIEGIRPPTWEAWGQILSYPVLLAAFTVAVVASVETLLCATAVDQMHNGERTRYDRELMAQGVGNTLCGFCGAIPMTGVIVRSAANLEAGGKTRLSTILHGVWLLGLVALLPGLLKMIPTTALAAVLILVGLKLMAPRAVFELARFGKGEVIIYLATLVTIVATDLLIGVGVGIALALIKLLWTASQLKIRVENGENKTIVHLAGAATFIRLPYLAGVLESMPEDAEVHVHLDNLSYIDHACLELLVNWEKKHEASGGTLILDWNHLNARFG